MHKLITAQNFQVDSPEPPILSGGERVGFVGSYPYSPSGWFQ
jgi:hypothetical protein